ncbi:MAG: hypothetical protein ACRDL7_13660, partial [Gaiellaceae bacterium]
MTTKVCVPPLQEFGWAPLPPASVVCSGAIAGGTVVGVGVGATVGVAVIVLVGVGTTRKVIGLWRTTEPFPPPGSDPGAEVIVT